MKKSIKNFSISKSFNFLVSHNRRIPHDWNRAEPYPHSGEALLRSSRRLSAGRPRPTSACGQDTSVIRRHILSEPVVPLGVASRQKCPGRLPCSARSGMTSVRFVHVSSGDEWRPGWRAHEAWTCHPGSLTR